MFSLYLKTIVFFLPLSVSIRRQKTYFLSIKYGLENNPTLYTILLISSFFFILFCLQFFNNLHNFSVLPFYHSPLPTGLQSFKTEEKKLDKVMLTIILDAAISQVMIIYPINLYWIKISHTC